LGIWTHHLKSISFVNYTSQQYSGPAIKMGAGVQAWEAYEAASANGVRVVGGTCPTVGLAGGYTQGGGHSTLSSLYGLGADQALEWEVVTADGQYLVATPTQYSDLYWALSGGGGGTYAVVLSLTAKAHRDGVVGGASISFSSQGISQATYWDAIGYWLPLVTKLSDAGGASSVFTITSEAFNLGPYTSDGKSVAEVKAELKPFVVELDKRNMTYSYNVTSLPGFLQHFTTYLGPLPYGQYGTGEILGSRLIPQSLVASDNAALTSALRNITDAGFLIDGLTQTPTHAAASNTAASNAVLPAWRVSAAHIVVSIAWNYTAPWASNVAREDEITHVIVPQLEDITPDSGTYLNEGDFQLVTWKRDFYGSNYDRLRAVKTAYDGHDLFYATTAVGSDAWIVAEDGRLCRAA